MIFLVVLHSYILNVPFNNDDETGIVYVWIGSKSDGEDARLIQEIAEEMFNNVGYSFSDVRCLIYNPNKRLQCAV